MSHNWKNLGKNNLISRCGAVGSALVLGLRERFNPPYLEKPLKHWVFGSFKLRFLGFDPIFDHNCGTWFFKFSLIQFNISGCGAVGSARHLGCRCRRFEPCHSDQKSRWNHQISAAFLTIQFIDFLTILRLLAILSCNSVYFISKNIITIISAVYC